MNVSISTNYARGISVPRGANVKASKVARVQSPLLDLEAFSETATSSLQNIKKCKNPVCGHKSASRFLPARRALFE